MSWLIEEHKVGKNQMELQVVIKLKELAKVTHATQSDQFIDSFKTELLTVKRKNIFAAEYAYKMVSITSIMVEVWKIKVDGDFHYKMFTLRSDGKQYNPFNF